MVKTVLVCCHANRWRSPLAAAFLQRYNFLSVTQAGFLAGGHRAGKPVRVLAAKMGLDLEGHRSTQLTAELVFAVDYVVVMNPTQLAKLTTWFGRPRGEQRLLLGEYLVPAQQSIPDLAFINPSSPEFERVVQMIFKATRKLAESLQKG